MYITKLRNYELVCDMYAARIIRQRFWRSPYSFGIAPQLNVQLFHFNISTHTHSQTLWICLHFFAEDCTSIELYVFYRLIFSFGSSGISSCVLSLFAKLLRAFRMKQLENCLNWCTSRTNGWEIINNNKQPARVTLDEYMKNTNELKRDIQIHKNDGFYVQTFN